METRTCPHCKYQYSVKDYLKKLSFKFVLAEWKCMNCGREITFSVQRRLMLAVAMGLFGFSVSVLVHNIEMTKAIWAIIIPILIIGTFFIFSFDKFRKAE